MITITIAGRDAIPLRALPFVSGGFIDGRTLVEVTVDHDRERGWPRLETFTLTPSGQVESIPASWFALMKAETRTGTREERRAKIPASVLTWVDGAINLFDSMVLDFIGWGPESAPVDIAAWVPNPPLTTAQRDFVFEGIQVNSTMSPIKVPRGKLTQDGVDLSLKDEAIRIARSLMSQNGRRPTRRRVAVELAKTAGMPAATIERRIRASWW